MLKIKSKEELLKSHYLGAIFKTFIFSELLKNISFSDDEVEIFHYRTSDKKEIDFILTNRLKTVELVWIIKLG